jgi:hypothetical protein
MIRAPKFVIVGCIFVALALLFFTGSLSLNLGTAGRMGPGYFPLMLSVVLGALGLSVLAVGFFHDGDLPSAPNIRALIFVGLGVGFFAYAVRPLGIVPAVAVSSLLFSLAGREFKLLTAVIAALVLSLGSWALFVVGLSMPWPAFGPLIW